MTFLWKKSSFSFLLILLILFCTILIGLVFSGIIQSCSKAKNDIINLGYVATLSGRFSDSGIKARNGLELAVSKINKEGGISGRQVSLITKDNLNDEKTNAKVIRELIIEGVVTIIGPLKSNMARSSLDSIKGENVLMIGPTAVTDLVKDLDDNLLRIMPVATGQASSLAEKMMKDGHRTVSVVYDASNLAYTHSLYLEFEEIFKGQGNAINFVYAMDNKTASAFYQAAKKIVQANPDALLLITSGIDAAFLCQQIQKINSEMRIYGSYWVKSGNLIEEGGKSVEGLTIVTPFSRPEQSPAYLSFKDSYTKEYKLEPQYLSIYAYDAIQMAFDGMSQARITDDASSIKKSILEKEIFEGLEDDFKINQFGDAVRKDMFVVVRNGKFERVFK